MRCVVAVLLLFCLVASQPRPAFGAAPLPNAKETDARLQSDGKGWKLDRAKIVDKTRPRVLLIGDSILNGYRKDVINALNGKAYVDTWVNPYCQSPHTNKVLAQVLANGPYDVVHFNMGLHGWQEGRIKPGTFEPLTKAYVQVIRDKLPKARVIWASSTPVTVKGKPTELEPKINPVIVEHNRMAAKVMAEMKVPVNDFYGLLVNQRKLARGDMFHWTKPAYQMLAKQVIASVSRALPIKPAPSGSQATEPTNAKEAAAKDAAAKAAAKKKAEAAIDAKYQAWVKTLSPARQAWERKLQQELGGFYLPIHKKQKVAGRSNAWDFVEDDPALPRVLLIGDSVSRGYTQATRKALAGKANVHRAPANCGPTSTGLRKIEVWLGDGKWDVIHFNFGIHDRNTPIPDYTKRLGQLVQRMKKTGATVVWASTTPIPDLPGKRYTAKSIVDRNHAAAAVMKKHGVATNDLFAAITPHLGTMQNRDDVHFNGKGYDFLGQRVAEAVMNAAKKRK